MTHDVMPKRTMLVALWLGLASIVGGLLLTTPFPTSAGEATVQRVVFGSAGFSESNRFWNVARPEHLQFDPFLETLLDVDPKSGEFVPRLAEKWQASPDLKEWTFFCARECNSITASASSRPRT
jgi:ABC-type transport system substrate-binding protein